MKLYVDEIRERIREIYNQCVDETENPTIIYDRTKNKILSALLDVLEYIQGNSEENPIDEIF